MSQSFERGMEPARESFRRRKVMTLGEVAEVIRSTIHTAAEGALSWGKW